MRQYIFPDFLNFYMIGNFYDWNFVIRNSVH
jgi:hypothetical protein